MEVAGMKLNKVAAMLASELLLDKRLYDEKAETCREIAVKTGISHSRTKVKLSNLVKAGKLEMVYKRTPLGPIPAYRVKK